MNQLDALLIFFPLWRSEGLRFDTVMMSTECYPKKA
jgi:hypothetical protein